MGGRGGGQVRFMTVRPEWHKYWDFLHLASCFLLCGTFFVSLPSGEKDSIAATGTRNVKDIRFIIHLRHLCPLSSVLTVACCWQRICRRGPSRKQGLRRILSLGARSLVMEYSRSSPNLIPLRSHIFANCKDIFLERMCFTYEIGLKCTFA